MQCKACKGFGTWHTMPNPDTPYGSVNQCRDCNGTGSVATRNVLHYFHVHDGKGAGEHGDPEHTYSIMLACDEHEPVVAAREDAEYIATSEADDDEQCDECARRAAAEGVS